MPAVELYTTGYCPYCVRAKHFLDSKQVKYTEIRVDGDPQLYQTMRERANGGHTVPQIFIDDKHIGGCDDMLHLEAQGQLAALLKY